MIVTEVQSEKLKVKSEVEFGSQKKPIGVTIYDKQEKPAEIKKDALNERASTLIRT